ncbi:MULTISPECIES: fasciclin domain-containing protein [Methanoculleus]|uniref:Beta-Ig-H3/fasciclin n=2 Tax=Methanoculleus TaxID=45989 RepID=A3CWA2_METMJ|nr:MULTISPECIES: fasciclin domain-containing protein [Methanoculleus]ABN57652.1 beta-Ig-H3/fasciclin [Methanoculleus marisnigri JR1]UYU19048.1 fasciclin domain-containing protein [Methanoculleus submarinus]
MKSIFETAREDGRLSTSVAMLQAGGMAETLLERGEYTALFPTNEAYSVFSREVLDAVAADLDRLTEMIRYHVIQGKLTTHELSRMEAIRTLQGDHLDITGTPGAIRLNDAAVIQPDIECTNGIYHVIDRVLLPRAVEARVKR